MEERKFEVDFLGEKINCCYVREPETARAMLTLLGEREEKALYGIDTETRPNARYLSYPEAGLSPHLSSTRLLQVFDGRNSIVFDLLHIGDNAAFTGFLSEGRFIAHNAVFDLQYFLKMGVKSMNLGCTRILSKLLFHATYPTDAGLDASLAGLTEQILKTKILKTMQRSNWSEPDLTFEQIQYAALDAVAVLKIAERLAPGLRKYGLERVYKLSKDVQLPIAKMQLNGLKIDVEAHKLLITKWREDAHIAKKGVLKATGLDDVTSAKIAGWLEKNLPPELLKVWPKTPGGKLSTDAHTFSDFSDLEMVKPLLAFQKAATLCSTFGQGLLNRINPETGRVHAKYNICGARTGRLSSSTPNLQNMPRSDEMRSIFKAREKKTLLSADYSQIELRVAAELSGDRAMLKAYRDGIDLHKLTASKVSRKPLDKITKEDRQLSKALNFGLIFGLGAKKFVHYAKLPPYEVVLTEREAEQAVETFRESYPEYREWQLDQANNAKESLRCKTPCGKVRRLAEDETFGAAMNQPVQGGAAEVMQHALIDLEKKGMELLNTVHDEVVLEEDDEEVEETSKEVVDVMTNAYLEVFPNGITRDLVNVGHGNSWAEAK